MILTSEYLSIPQAARQSGGRVSESTLRRWVDAGLIDGCIQTLSGRVLLPTNAVDRLITPFAVKTAD